MKYSYVKKSPFDFLETVDELIILFSEEWFWLVSNLDVAEKIRKKVNPDFLEYRVLGFCKPEIAVKYLMEDMNLWVFFPCSVVVYEKENGVYISAGFPEDIINEFINNKILEKLSIEVSKIMKKVIDNI